MHLVLEKLRESADPVKALAQQKYHKSERLHLGVTLPICTQVALDVSKNLEQEAVVKLAKELWESEIFDAMMCAGKLLCQRRIKPNPQLWATLESFLTKVDGWALEDLLAPMAWKCILAEEKLLDQLEGWTLHTNFWMRRAALVYTLPYAKKGRDPERMLTWAAGYVGEREWFIQKAIGWWLRTLGEHNPARVRAFLHTYPLKGVALREATRKL